MIEPAGSVGDVAEGVIRALHELDVLKRRGDTNPKGIIIISASESPPASRSLQMFQTATREVLQRIGSDEWYVQYCYLDGVRDRVVEAFVTDNRGLSYNVNALKAEHGTETIEELYGIVDSPQEMGQLRLLDQKGAVLGADALGQEWTPLKAGMDIAEGVSVRTADGSHAVIEMRSIGKIGIAPDTRIGFVAARTDPLTGNGILNMIVHTGSLWFSFAQKPASTVRLQAGAVTADLSGKTAAIEYSETTNRLLVTSLCESFSVTPGAALAEPNVLSVNQMGALVAGQALEQVESAEPHVLEGWKRWSKVLTGGVPLASVDFSVPTLVFPAKEITIGPVRSGEALSSEYSLKTEGVENVAGLKLDVDISVVLPEGLGVSTGIVDGDDPGTSVLALRVDGTAGFSARRKEAFKGFMKIGAAPDSRIMFEQVIVPLTITAKGPLVPMPVLLIGGAVILVGVGLLAVGHKTRKRDSVRAKPHRVIGRLIGIEDPTGGRVGTVNLEELSTKSSRLSLVVGKDRTVEVRLKHASVSSTHCTIEALLMGGRLDTYVEPIGASRMEVDGQPITSRTLLNDGARVRIGDFTFQFEDSQLYKKVEIVRKSGRRVVGILDAAGMDAEGLRLSPMDAVSPSERARVKYADISYATFYRRSTDVLSGKPRSTPRADTLKKVELMFKRGNTVTGYVQREYSEGRRRYIELLPLDLSSDIDYTLVDAAAVVEKKSL
jgi:hypothetical protein